jgi:DNA-binding transcriptional ArsR family regulator
MMEAANRAANMVKAVANRDRLLILCLLAEKEMNVSELKAMLGLHQPTLSQQLARLRRDSLVSTRRQGKTIIYRLASNNAERVVKLLYEMYCGPDAES